MSRLARIVSVDGVPMLEHSARWCPQAKREECRSTIRKAADLGLLLSIEAGSDPDPKVDEALQEFLTGKRSLADLVLARDPTAAASLPAQPSEPPPSVVPSLPDDDAYCLVLQALARRLIEDPKALVEGLHVAVTSRMRGGTAKEVEAAVEKVLPPPPPPAAAAIAPRAPDPPLQQQGAAAAAAAPAAAPVAPSPTEAPTATAAAAPAASQQPGPAPTTALPASAPKAAPAVPANGVPASSDRQRWTSGAGAQAAPPKPTEIKAIAPAKIPAPRSASTAQRSDSRPNGNGSRRSRSRTPQRGGRGPPSPRRRSRSRSRSRPRRRSRSRSYGRYRSRSRSYDRDRRRGRSRSRSASRGGRYGRSRVGASRSRSRGRLPAASQRAPPPRDRDRAAPSPAEKGASATATSGARDSTKGKPSDPAKPAAAVPAANGAAKAAAAPSAAAARQGDTSGPGKSDKDKTAGTRAQDPHQARAPPASSGKAAASSKSAAEAPSKPVAPKPGTESSAVATGPARTPKETSGPAAAPPPPPPPPTAPSSFPATPTQASGPAAVPLPTVPPMQAGAPTSGSDRQLISFVAAPDASTRNQNTPRTGGAVQSFAQETNPGFQSAPVAAAAPAPPSWAYSAPVPQPESAYGGQQQDATERGPYYGDYGQAMAPNGMPGGVQQYPPMLSWGPTGQPIGVGQQAPPAYPMHGQPYLPPGGAWPGPAGLGMPHLGPPMAAAMIGLAHPFPMMPSAVAPGVATASASALDRVSSESVYDRIEGIEGPPIVSTILPSGRRVEVVSDKPSAALRGADGQPGVNIVRTSGGRLVEVFDSEASGPAAAAGGDLKRPRDRAINIDFGEGGMEEEDYSGGGKRIRIPAADDEVPVSREEFRGLLTMSGFKWDSLEGREPWSKPGRDLLFGRAAEFMQSEAPHIPVEAMKVKTSSNNVTVFIWVPPSFFDDCVQLHERHHWGSFSGLNKLKIAAQQGPYASPDGRAFSDVVVFGKGGAGPGLGHGGPSSGGAAAAHAGRGGPGPFYDQGPFSDSHVVFLDFRDGPGMSDIDLGDLFLALFRFGVLVRGLAPNPGSIPGVRGKAILWTDRKGSDKLTERERVRVSSFDVSGRRASSPFFSYDEFCGRFNYLSVNWAGAMAAAETSTMPHARDLAGILVSHPSGYPCDPLDIIKAVSQFLDQAHLVQGIELPPADPSQRHSKRGPTALFVRPWEAQRILQAAGSGPLGDSGLRFEADKGSLDKGRPPRVLRSTSFVKYQCGLWWLHASLRDALRGGPGVSGAGQD